MRREKKDNVTRGELLRAFRETPPAFSAGVDDTLRRLTSGQEETIVKRKLTFAPVLVLILVLLAGVAVAAALYPRTTERFGAFYGADFQNRLEQGDAAEVGTSYTLGDVTYTVTDVIWANGVLYGTVVMEPAEGANIVLIPEDVDVNEPAGYNIHYGETAPEGAKSYRELAQERGARIVLAQCSPEGYLLGDELLNGDIGRFDTAVPEGAVISSFELYGWNGGIDRAERYTLCMSVHSWEVTPEGEWLREEPNNTWLKAQWDVTVVPEMKEAEGAEGAPEPVDAAGMEILTPEGFDGKLSAYAVTTTDYMDVLTPEMITDAAVLQETRSEYEVVYRFEGDDVLCVDADGGASLSAYDGTEERYNETEDGSPAAGTIPHDELVEYVAGLVLWERFWADDGNLYARPELADDLAGLTLADARGTVETLLKQLGIGQAELAFACRVDVAYARALSEARNAQIEEGLWYNVNPRDISEMTEQDEGYELVYRACVDGVPVDEQYMEIRAFVTAEGIRSMTLRAPFALGDAKGEAQTLLSAQEALAYAVREAENSWLAELAEGFAHAERAQLIYAVKDKTRLLPAWRFTKLSGEKGEYDVVISALDGSLLNAPWL